MDLRLVIDRRLSVLSGRRHGVQNSIEYRYLPIAEVAADSSTNVTFKPRPLNVGLGAYPNQTPGNVL